eukprot:764758-Hanusia_phi.AAC.1
MNVLRAAIEYNRVSLDEAFDQLDFDEDGEISIDDLRKAAKQLSLGLEAGQIEDLHRRLRGNKGH